MIWLLLIVSCALLIGTGLFVTEKTTFDMEWIIALGVIGILFLLSTFFIGTFVSSLSHADDLESVEYHTERVEIQEVRLERLRGTLQNFDYPEGALMDKDSPVASIVGEISETEKSIAEAKEAIVKTQKNIRSRKLWIFSFVTKIVTKGG